MLQAEFQIPKMYGTDTVIKKPNASACFLGVSLGSNKKTTRVAWRLIFCVSVPKVCPNLVQTILITVCYRISSYSTKTDFDTKTASTLKDCISALDANFSTIFADSEGKWHQEWLCIKKFHFGKGSGSVTVLFWCKNLINMFSFVLFSCQMSLSNQLVVFCFNTRAMQYT